VNRISDRLRRLEAATGEDAGEAETVTARWLRHVCAENPVTLTPEDEARNADILAAPDAMRLK
jgi:hypothetical protein